MHNSVVFLNKASMVFAGRMFGTYSSVSCLFHYTCFCSKCLLVWFAYLMSLASALFYPCVLCLHTIHVVAVLRFTHKCVIAVVLPEKCTVLFIHKDATNVMKINKYCSRILTLWHKPASVYYVWCIKYALEVIKKKEKTCMFPCAGANNKVISNTHKTKIEYVE